MKCTGIGRTHVGLQRAQNEDAFLVNDELGLFAVCDGMGGHAAGEVAAETALEGLSEAIREDGGAETPEHPPGPTGGGLAEAVSCAVQQANATVYSLANSNADYAGMGTTLTMVYVKGHRAVIGHVGDSRLYLVRNGQASQLTDDHTFMNEIIEQGLVDPLLNHRCLRHILTRAIGTRPDVPVDTLVFDLLPNDVCLLCSDGLTQSLEGPDELQEALANNTPEEAAENLVELANSRGGQDNVTVVLVTPDFDDEDRPSAKRRARQIEDTIGALHSAFLFHDLPLSELLHILDIVEVGNHRRGNVLMKRGETALHYSLIIRGTIEQRATGRRKSGTLGPGEGFGAESLLEGHAAAVAVGHRQAVESWAAGEVGA